jgi:hypothetical protein
MIRLREREREREREIVSNITRITIKIRNPENGIYNHVTRVLRSLRDIWYTPVAKSVQIWEIRENKKEKEKIIVQLYWSPIQTASLIHERAGRADFKENSEGKIIYILRKTSSRVIYEGINSVTYLDVAPRGSTRCRIASHAFQ